MLEPDDYIAFVTEDCDESIIQDCCDSAIAVLTPAQIQEWIEKFTDLILADEASEYLEYGASTSSFKIDNELLVVVSDSGGEYTVDEFVDFCKNKNIQYQIIVDTIDCTGVSVEEIYTGEYDKDIKLLTLLHAVYN